MRHRGLILAALSGGVFLAALLTGPPSFDGTDGAEFAVCGPGLQIAHSPGYPLFLMILRTASMVMSPLYGHLRLVNCLLGALLVPVAAAAFSRHRAGPSSSVYTSVLLLTLAPVMAQLNSLEVYPLAMLLALSAIALRRTALMPYAAGMAIFAGHPVSILSLPLMWGKHCRKGLLLLTGLIPLTLLLYVPIRAGSSAVAHYGRPESLVGLLGYLTMYSGRLGAPSFGRLLTALSTIGPCSGAVLALLAAAGGRPRYREDVPILLALLFLASYELPDPAGQLWILLIPLCLRAAGGMERILFRGVPGHLFISAAVMLSAVQGLRLADRSTDDIAMRWTTDVLSGLPPGAIYRPVAHDTFYAAYAVHTLGFRGDIMLSDPYGNFFELVIPPPIPPVIGERTVHISRAWERNDAFQLRGLIFHPVGNRPREPNWEIMDIFRFQGTSPDPMSLDIAAEAWARRMLQEESPALRDSFAERALEFASTEQTKRRIEHLEDIQ